MVLSVDPHESLNQIIPICHLKLLHRIFEVNTDSPANFPSLQREQGVLADALFNKAGGYLEGILLEIYKLPQMLLVVEVLKFAE